MTTRFLADILRQPAELQRSLDYLTSEHSKKALVDAATAIKGARHLFVTGIGASWHAAMNVAALFQLGGRPVCFQDASELLHFGAITPDSAIIVLSRSGKSIEIVRLIAKAKSKGAVIIGVTNSADAPLALESDFTFVPPADRDHGISVNTYVTLNLAAGLLSVAAADELRDAFITSLSRALRETQNAMSLWKGQLERSNWPATGHSYYFLGRGTSLGSCHEARLLWEEAAKYPASAMSTGNFRHGPQEIVTSGSRFILWIDDSLMRTEDLEVARDLRRLGAAVIVIGQDLSPDAGDIVFQIPRCPKHWQFLVDIMPAQLAAEHFAQLAGSDCDSFRICSYVVESERGLQGDPLK